MMKNPLAAVSLMISASLAPTDLNGVVASAAQDTPGPLGEAGKFDLDKHSVNHTRGAKGSTSDHVLLTIL